MRKSFDTPKIVKSSNVESFDRTDAPVLTIISGCTVAGLSIQDIRQLTMGEVFSLLELRFQTTNPKEKSNVREATQADIDAFLS